jgi:hypothetical protein
MSNPSLPLVTIPQSISLSFSGGIFLGIYLISAVYANRWLIFTDDGWKVRESIHWHVLVITNIAVVFAVMNQVLGIVAHMGQAAYVERGHQISEYVEPPWIAIVRVSP